MSVSGHVKVWKAYAEFEAARIPLREEDREDEEEDEDEEERYVDGDVDKARLVFEKGYKDLKSKGLKEEVRDHVHTHLTVAVFLTSFLYSVSCC